jgi:glycosyltransferase involved in cell wall biosynthesis
MRIAIITTVHPPLDIRIFHKEAISLERAGHSIILLAMDGVNAEEMCRLNNITYKCLGTARSRLGRPKLWYRLIKMLSPLNVDVWHFHDPELLPILIFIRYFLRRKVQIIYDAHEDVPKDILDKTWITPSLRRIVSKIADWVEGWGIQHCDYVIAATDSIGAHVSYSTSKYVVVHNYPVLQTETNLDRSVNGDRPIQVIYQGNLTRMRGVKEVVQAMSLIQDKNVELILLGEIYPEAFKKEIQEIAGKNVVIKGKVPYDQVPAYLQSSDIGIINFLPYANQIESMPNKLFEYMQFGLPVVASDFPLWRAIIEESDCGCLVDPNTPESIAQAIYCLAADKELRRKKGNAGFRSIQDRYSWQNESLTLLNLYKTISEQFGIEIINNN